MNDKLSVIVPAFNEASTIAAVIDRILALRAPRFDLEVIVVNDGSTDRTKEELSRFRQSIVYVEHAVNEGKGAAIRSGLARATGRFTMIQDADLEYAPENLSKLLSALETHPEWTAVYGSRNLAPTERGYSHYVLGVWLLSKLVNLVFGSRLTDAYTCHKLMRTNVLRDLDIRSNGFEVEMEITAKILRSGGSIGEIAISYAPRSFREGKKIRAVDGLRGLLMLAKIRLSRRRALPAVVHLHT